MNQPEAVAPPKITEILLVTATLVLITSFLRLPHSMIPWSYYDDAEGVYHAFSIASGRLPYLEDATHHFLGYTLPYLLLAPFTGFSFELVRISALLHISLTGLFTYLGCRSFTRPFVSLVAALLVVSAGQPETAGFYIQFELNLILSAILCCLLWHTVSSRDSLLKIASFLLGLLICYDQRMVVYLPLIPILLLWQCNFGRAFFRNFILEFVLPFIVAPLAGFLYLFCSGIINEFIFQVYTYPREYRIGSLNFFSVIYEGIRSHWFLLEKTPIFTGAAIAGCLAIAKKSIRNFRAAQKLILLLTLVLSIFPPLFGGRYYEYYVVTYYPVFGILAGAGILLLFSIRKSIGITYYLLLFLQPLFAMILAYSLLRYDHFLEFSGDGNKEVAAYLQENAEVDDQIFVWGYRPDIYLLIGRTSPSRFVNQMMIHPDGNLTQEEQALHVVPKYLEEFKKWWCMSPPNFVVTFNENDMSSSLAQQFVMGQLKNHYHPTFNTRKLDASKREIRFKIYSLSSSNASSTECAYSSSS